MCTVQRLIDAEKLSISGIKDIGGRSSQRWYRYIQYDGCQRLYLESQTFYCSGPVQTKFKVNVSQLMIPTGALQELLKVDAFVKRHSQLPATAPETWRKMVSDNGGDAQVIHKDLANFDRIYVAIADGAPVFSKKGREPFKETLASGEYKCLLHVRGVYIGAHGTLNKYSSLQVKVQQILYTPMAEVEEKCLFLPDDGEEEEAKRKVRDQQEQDFSHIDEILASITTADMEENVIRPSGGDSGTSSSSLMPPAPLPPLPGCLPPTPVSTRSNTRSGLARRRKAVGLTLDLGGEPQAKVNVDKQARELMRTFAFLNYPTQDEVPEEFESRLQQRRAVSEKLVALLGAEWEWRYYKDFQQEMEKERD